MECLQGDADPDAAGGLQVVLSSRIERGKPLGEIAAPSRV